ncbi:DNA-binding protein [Chelatococcus daeguensis]|nr:DNA-binding protein [Chelatococcus daeguensis]
MAAARKRERGRQLARLEWLRDITEVIGHYIKLPKVDIPDLVGTEDWRTLREEDLERMATELRHHWRLGLGPITNVLTPIERAGIIVACDEMGTTNLDGLCRWSATDGRPYVLLATDKMNFYRRQMDAAHEMAHAVLHRGVAKEELKSNFEVVERQAFRLASAFLMPSETFALAAAQPTISRFRVLKDTWRVSIKAMIHRCQDLEIIDRDQATQMYKYYSARGWSKGEPGDDVMPIQKPRLLSQALSMIVDEGLRTKEDLLYGDFTLSAGDIEGLCGLPSGWFESKTGDVVPLQIQPRRGDNKLGGGEIIAFGRK